MRLRKAQKVALRLERVERLSGTGGKNQEDPSTIFMRKTLGVTTPLPTAHSAAECPSPQKTRVSCKALNGPEARPALAAFRSPSEEGGPSVLSPLMQQFSAVRILVPRGRLAVSGAELFGCLGGQPTWDRHLWHLKGGGQ